MKSADMAQLWLFGFVFTIRLYRSGRWGTRVLDYPFNRRYPRVALDLGRVSFLFERYWWGNE